jgi:hypothetical protein
MHVFIKAATLLQLMGEDIVGDAPASPAEPAMNTPTTRVDTVRTHALSAHLRLLHAGYPRQGAN